jgi:hypothetical protein
MKANQVSNSTTSEKSHALTRKAKKRVPVRKAKKTRRIPSITETPATIKRLKQAIKEGGFVSQEAVEKEFGVK